MDTNDSVPRMVPGPGCDATAGQVRWAPLKSLWLAGMTAVALVAGPFTASWGAVGAFLILTGITLCLGHSLGMHRRLIHNAYDCPLWLEYVFVYCGVLVGMAGPLGMVRTHDMRDWAQRQGRCHDYFAHRRPFWHDAWWQLHCELRLDHPPAFAPEPRIARSAVYCFMERTWMLQQLPVALVLLGLGGWGWVVWGVCARVAVCVTGHWLVGHFAHRQGHQNYRVEGAGVQGYNVGLWGLNGWLTMGECWHNNHHAFPGSARLGLHRGQTDPGFWVLQALRRAGLVRRIRLPGDLPPRPQVRAVNHLHALEVSHGA